MKLFKKILGAVLVGTCALGLASCAEEVQNETQPTKMVKTLAAGQKAKIAVGLYTTQGAHYDALDAFLNSIENDLNVEFSLFAYGNFDEATVISATETQIAAGVDGIIATMDAGTAQILEKCAESNVYYGGYLCDFDSSWDEIKNHPNFVGTAIDGAYNGYNWGKAIAERVIADGCKNVGMLRFPSYAYPHQSEMDSEFRATIAAYNATASAANKITVQENTTEVGFGPFEATYFNDNPNIDAIFGMCGALDNVYPVMKQLGKNTSIKLYTAGYSDTNDIYNDFGAGKCIQEMVYCNVESIIYPVVLMLNGLRGQLYGTMPYEAVRVECSQMRVQTKADLDLVRAHSVYHTKNGSDSIITGAEVKALLAVNHGTYTQLVKAVSSMSLEDLRAKHTA